MRSQSSANRLYSFTVGMMNCAVPAFQWPQSSSASRFTTGAFGFLTFTQCVERCRQLRRAILTQRAPCERPSWRHTPLDATRLTPFRAKPSDRARSPSCALTRRTAPRSAGTHHTYPLGHRPRWSHWEGMPIPPNCASSRERYSVTN
jgi:hypothetical protein